MQKESDLLRMNDLKKNKWEFSKYKIRSMKKSLCTGKGTTKSDSTCDSLGSGKTASQLYQSKIKNRKSKKEKNKTKSTKKAKEAVNDDSFEKIISETSGLSLEVDSATKEINQKFYYMPNLKQAYYGKNEPQRKVLIDQFSKFLKNLFKNDFQPNEEFVRLNKVYCPVKQKNKKCLVLDLDETLIFAHEEIKDTNFDEQIKLYIGEGQTHTIMVYFRPHLRDFLEYVSKKWEIVIFTSSSSIYANAILQRIDPDNKYFSFRLFKDSCYRDCNDHLIKDLSIIGNRTLKETVMVDNSIDSVIYQLDNCIPIVPYYGDSKDQELVQLAKFLDILHVRDNLQSVCREYFKLKDFLNFDNLKDIEQFIVEEL